MLGVVFIANTRPAFAQRPALTRDVDNGDLAPVRFLISLSLDASQNFKELNGFTVPAGKRLVVENVSIWAFTSSSSDKITGIWLEAGTDPYYLLLDPAANEVRTISGGTVGLAAYNRLVKAYFEAGELVHALVFADGNAGSKIVNIYVSGHYVTP
jgi:hypothetical protein